MAGTGYPPAFPLPRSPVYGRDWIPTCLSTSTVSSLWQGLDTHLPLHFHGLQFDRDWIPTCLSTSMVSSLWQGLDTHLPFHFHGLQFMAGTGYPPASPLPWSPVYGRDWIPTCLSTSKVSSLWQGLDTHLPFHFHGLQFMAGTGYPPASPLPRSPVYGRDWIPTCLSTSTVSSLWQGLDTHLPLHFHGLQFMAGTGYPPASLLP
ncbi:hypothetical protein OTU49_011620 [Cherax quadricarinatus]|uniref:Uncharacterized protein n=1 Tax=Cherax quadricarinatus TaxID=27406 RepID=A0AAW0W2X2_CHEQU